MMFTKQLGRSPGREATHKSREAEFSEPFDYLRISTFDPNAGTERVITVFSVAVVASKFLAGGGSIVRPERAIPGIGKLVSCRDRVGQVFTFLEEDCPTHPEKIIFGRDRSSGDLSP